MLAYGTLAYCVLVLNTVVHRSRMYAFIIYFMVYITYISNNI